MDLRFQDIIDKDLNIYIVLSGLVLAKVSVFCVFCRNLSIQYLVEN